MFGDQLACADLVILNKTDLVAPERLATLRRDIEARLRPGVKLVAARDGAVPPEVALGLAAAAEDDLAARPSLHDLDQAHDHDDFESFVVTPRTGRRRRRRFWRGCGPPSPRTTSCGSKALSIFPAATGGRSCRRSATGCSIISTGRGEPGEARATRGSS